MLKLTLFTALMGAAFVIAILNGSNLTAPLSRAIAPDCMLPGSHEIRQVELRITNSTGGDVTLIIEGEKVVVPPSGLTHVVCPHMGTYGSLEGLLVVTIMCGGDKVERGLNGAHVENGRPVLFVLL